MSMQKEINTIIHLRMKYIFIVTHNLVADPIKLFFFANKEFFHFLLVSLSVCCILQKLINSKMT